MTTKNCRKCGKGFPRSGVIWGRYRNLNNRKFCFDCSPFGKHNTKQLDKSKVKKPKICICCGKEHLTKGKRCFSCSFNKRQKKITKKVQRIVGKSCCICGYDRSWKNICFHHVFPKSKMMNLTTRELAGRKWKVVLDELQKCIPLCANCHGEVHDGLIPMEKIKSLHLDFWNKKEQH